MNIEWPGGLELKALLWLMAFPVVTVPCKARWLSILFKKPSEQEQLVCRQGLPQAPSFPTPPFPIPLLLTPPPLLTSAYSTYGYVIGTEAFRNDFFLSSTPLWSSCTRKKWKCTRQSFRGRKKRDPFDIYSLCYTMLYDVIRCYSNLFSLYCFTYLLKSCALPLEGSGCFVSSLFFSGCFWLIMDCLELL